MRLAYFDGAGKISGPATEPQISTSSFVVDLAINVAGMPLTLISSTCSQVIAGIEAPTSAAMGQAGVAGWVYERLLKAPRRRYR